MFSFAGLIAGWAGAIYAFHEGFVGPSTVGVTTSTYAVLYGLFGGVGTLIGPVIGAGVIEGLTVILSDNETLKAYWPIALGAVMLVVVAYQPTGLVGLLVSQRERFDPSASGRAGNHPGPMTPERQPAMTEPLLKVSGPRQGLRDAAR